jgi:site-specific DNA-cytosine methylase
MYTAVDCLGFAGGFTLGVVKSGFELVGKRELPGGFGVANCEVNRHLLGNRWVAEVGEDVSWSPVAADLVFGNPPCSGFSVMTDKKFRGEDSPINHCMWSFAEYAARCRPQVAVFESVRSAFKMGGGLMRRLRARLEERTGLRYDLHHVLHDAYDLGGAARRPRYFWVASQVPFGVEFPRLARRPTLLDVIGDVQDAALTWTAQPYRTPPSWWSKDARSDAGWFDGHITKETPYARRALDLDDFLAADGGWPAGMGIAQVAKMAYERHGHLPPSWDGLLPKLQENGWQMGFTTAVRWRPHDPGRVITGSALVMVLHPTRSRMITYREAARVMGFPDDWVIRPLRRASSMHMTWGKGITVQCGEWVGGWVNAALDGAPGTYRGEQIGDREWLVDPKVYFASTRRTWYDRSNGSATTTRRNA